MESLLAQLVALRDSWKAIWNEAKLIAFSLQLEVKLFRDRNSTAKKRTRFQYDDTPDKNVNEMNEADESTEKAHFRNYLFISDAKTSIHTHTHTHAHKKRNINPKTCTIEKDKLLVIIVLLESLQFISVQKTNFGYLQLCLELPKDVKRRIKAQSS